MFTDKSMHAHSGCHIMTKGVYVEIFERIIEYYINL